MTNCPIPINASPGENELLSVADCPNPHYHPVLFMENKE
jgi:hypothetical protein